MEAEKSTLFRVKTNGYTEQCSSYNGAKQVFERLRKRKEKEGETSYKIVLERKIDLGWEIMDSINVKS